MYSEVPQPTTATRSPRRRERRPWSADGGDGLLPALGLRGELVLDMRRGVVVSVTETSGPLRCRL